MNLKNLWWMGLSAVLLAAPGLAQEAPTQANPAPGCSATAAQIEANKKVAMSFFTTPRQDRVALIDPSYKQHNPVFRQRAAEKKETDYEEFKSAFLNAPNQQQMQHRGQAGGNLPPRGNPFEVVTAECDMVTLIHKQYRPDPKADGQFYEFFTFDTFRVKNGKLVEHWDGSMLPPPRRQQQ